QTNKQKNKPFHKPPVKRLIWPSAIFLIIMTQVPFLITIYYSFQNWNLMRPDKGITFAGFSNFKKVLSEPSFYKVLGNTVILTLTILIICFVLGFAIALLM